MCKRKQRSGLNLAVYPPALPRPFVIPELPSLLPVLNPTGRISKEYHQLGARRRIGKKSPVFRTTDIRCSDNQALTVPLCPFLGMA